MSGMSNLWSGIGLASSGAAKTEKAKAQVIADVKYLYSAFTKIPCLRLSPDRKARLIGGYEEFPFDSAVPLLAFKNMSALEICDLDFRQFFGWDKLSESLRSLTVKRSTLDDPTDLFVNIVLDDMEKRRRRSSRAQSSPILPLPASPSLRFSDMGKTASIPDSPVIDDRFGHSASPQKHIPFPQEPDHSPRKRPRTQSASPSRPSSSRHDSTYRHIRPNPARVKRSGSNSSNSSDHSSGQYRNGSFSNLLSMGILPASKWRFLRHLSLADNSLTFMAASSLAPLSNTLHSLDLSYNLFTEMPDCLASLTALRALNVSNCMIESLHSLTRNPLPAITALNLRANRLISIAGVERLLSLERLDLRDNKIQDPTELARLTGIPDIHEVWVLRNPFVKTHSNYRVTIFNLFRKAPGYSEDLIIDSTSPGYSERRQLSQRVLEPEAVPVVKTLPVEPAVGLTPRTASAADAVKDLSSSKTNGVERPSLPQHTQSEAAVGSAHRRKGARRRIVDLAQDQSPPIVHQRFQKEPSGSFHTILSNDCTEDVSSGIKPSLLPPLQTSSDSPVSRMMDISDGRYADITDKGRSLASEIQSLNINGETYKQKVEALKNEVGSDWLNILREKDWNNREGIEASRQPYNHPGPTQAFRASSLGITSGGRTLG